MIVVLFHHVSYTGTYRQSLFTSQNKQTKGYFKVKGQCQIWDFLDEISKQKIPTVPLLLNLP